MSSILSLVELVHQTKQKAMNIQSSMFSNTVFHKDLFIEAILFCIPMCYIKEHMRKIKSESDNCSNTRMFKC